ncbi:protein-disulfide reductase DsbD family protein [Sphingobacterium faecium]|jgi:thiol:disulfide interchange protein|uniref:protein-disulfide reductase DsbD family protein n=1 Tax=Sphingobacterium faecium TaxID=34087 RepID=UPI00097F3879|nr:thioredoxin family protein [Sphingobacterium faecium]WGQ12660.1 thioredoxin family protein [Sphingobacterium faecium]SJN27886.1 Cytochrome c-type biogenesis protein DsbD, protein-disulfide reductase [Sphingobacterium faecium PCAi_F2.5]
MAKKKLFLLYFVIFSLFIPIFSFASTQDSLLSVEGIEFSESADTSTLSEVPTDLVFSESPDTITQDTAKNTQNIAITATPEVKKSLWGIFLAGLIGGFAALLMPCIFPMLPLTVSFFTKQSGSRANGISKALLYGLFIIIIYVALGMIITILFGSDALNALSTNGVFNFIFFLLLVAFAASFFGAFEITLPSSFVNKMDAKSDKGGLVGLFFMAFSLSLVSFSCTGPIIGTLLVEAASKGERLGPAIGMLGFSIALAIPFGLFAMFPSLLKSLPKSGGWLNSVKVVLGFLELALALKFLSNVDLAYHWNWLDREVFLSLWIVIFGLMGLYLIGKIKFSHDSELKFLSVPRTFLSIVVFSFVMYMIPGLWGAPLKSISAFLPPSATQDFDLSAGIANASPAHSDGKVKKYAEIFHERGTPKGFDPYYDYDQALETAKELKKPVLIDFTGWNCVNCRKMEANVWTDPNVAKLLKEGFVMAELFVDDRTELPVEEQIISAYSGKKIKNIGNKNSDFQASKFNSNSQPLYVIVDTEGNVLVPPSGANYDPVEYAKYLQSGIDAFNAKK